MPLKALALSIVFLFAFFKTKSRPRLGVCSGYGFTVMVFPSGPGVFFK